MNDFDDMFECFVISLSRTPKRLEAFQAQNVKCEVNFRHFEAIDGKQIGEAEMDRITTGMLPFKHSLIGNALSHLALWRRCSEQIKNLIILEDDAVVRHDLKTQLPNLVGKVEYWDIILLGYNTDVPLELSIAPNVIYGGGFSAPFPTAQQLLDFAASTHFVSLHRLLVGLGSCGYVVSPKGSLMLMRTCFPLDHRRVHYNSITHKFRAGSLDAMMATIYPQLAAYACVAPLVMTANNKTASTTKE